MPRPLAPGSPRRVDSHPTVYGEVTLPPLGSDDFLSRCSVSRSGGVDLAPEDEHEDRLSPVSGHGTGDAYHEAPLMKKPVAWTMTEAEWIAERKAVFAFYRNGAGKRR
jgi:hypothetical protein